MSASRKIGVIGFGRSATRSIGELVAAGLCPIVYEQGDNAAAAACRQGALVASSLEELLWQSDTIFIDVADKALSRSTSVALVAALDGVSSDADFGVSQGPATWRGFCASPDRGIVVLCGPQCEDDWRQFASYAAVRGIALVDAALVWTSVQTPELILLGGAENDIAVVRERLGVLGDQVRQIGRFGTASTAHAICEFLRSSRKLVENEACQMARDAGLDNGAIAYLMGLDSSTVSSFRRRGICWERALLPIPANDSKGSNVVRRP
jgi:3-hydroxyisobutyrate dehydrogenase-like beta-hydroxyacid dehydrogenase